MVKHTLVLVCRHDMMIASCILKTGAHLNDGSNSLVQLDLDLVMSSILNVEGYGYGHSRSYRHYAEIQYEKCCHSGIKKEEAS